jgi:hypothetical protein
MFNSLAPWATAITLTLLRATAENKRPRMPQVPFMPEPKTAITVEAIQRLFRTELKHGLLNPVAVHRDDMLSIVLAKN